MTDRGPRRRTLPPLVAEFVEALSATHKASTCASHGRRLWRFHQWLSDNHVELSELDRRHMTKWFVYLKRCGTQPVDRAGAVVVVRTYLRWLFEMGVVATPPDRLIRRSDIPKQPTYLPRPLSPEADSELQRRLTESSSPFHRGLLLMRKTGVRVGELRDLEYECLRVDFNGRHFLKVPLGKLDNERLVPLDESTLQVVHDLQKQGRTPRPWLLESVWGKKTWSKLYQRALREISVDLDPLHKITPHRLRHTYATEFLNAGMTLAGVMKLLGHRSMRMTLRYADITLETVGKEYFEALTQIERAYQITRCTPPAEDLDPVRALADVVRWLEKHAAQDRPVRLLIRRLIRARKDVLALTKP